MDDRTITKFAEFCNACTKQYDKYSDNILLRFSNVLSSQDNKDVSEEHDFRFMGKYPGR